jgi:hypothetical protein
MPKAIDAETAIDSTISCNSGPQGYGHRLFALATRYPRRIEICKTCPGLFFC